MNSKSQKLWPLIVQTEGVAAYGTTENEIYSLEIKFLKYICIK